MYFFNLYKIFCIFFFYRMQLFVGLITEGKTITIGFELSDTIMEIKRKIQDREDVPAECQVLLFRDKTLENDKTCEDYSIYDKATIFLTLRLKGGLSL